MRCPRCGAESGIEKNDKFCRECGFPLNVALKQNDTKVLTSFFLDVNSGVLLVNGVEEKKVTAFSLKFENGKYGLILSRDFFFKAAVPLSIEIGASWQVLEANDA